MPDNGQHDDSATGRGGEPRPDEADSPFAEEQTLSLAPGAAPQRRERAQPLPDSIGGYRIIRVLGEGGMGVVYEAEQQQPRRRVALKVMRRGHLVDEVHTRLFQREAETLGRLKHPNIAAIHESGHTEDGHDYFAMELVHGETLDGWLAGRPTPVTPDELELRLRLFRAIADGVHYAHQRGVIHRDLKPTNIIVQGDVAAPSHGGSGSPTPLVKVLDFGLARITDQDLAPSLLTEVGIIKGTVPYMSPEQALGRPDEIDVRTDVYALGVILYELLAGQRPYDTARPALVEALRVVCEEPPRPLRQSWSGVRKLDVDVETIVGKALEKEPARRYPSVAAMADDIDRYLTSRPISARPPSAFYQLRKFARRNRALVGGAVGALLVLVVFAITTAIQAERIRREADRAGREAKVAREVSEFLIGIFDSSDPTLTKGHEPSARELLESAASRIDDLDDQPLTQAAFMESIGRVYAVLGAPDRALPLLERAVELRGGDPAGSDELTLAAGLTHLANAYDVAGRFADAEAPARRAVEIRHRRLGDHPDLASSLNTLGNVLWHQGRLDEAEAEHRRALAIRDRVLPPGDPDIAQSLHNLGALRYFAGDYAEAERLYRRSIEIDEAAHGPDDYNLATSLHTLAIVMMDQGRLDEARTLELRALAIREKVLGPDHWHVALSLTTLGDISRRQGRPAAAEPLIRRAISIAMATWGPNHGELWWMRRVLARTLSDLGRFDHAEAEIRDLIATVERSGDVSELPDALEVLGELESARGRLAAAEEAYGRAIDLFEEEEPGGPRAGLAMARLGKALAAAGRPDEAEVRYRQGIERMAAGWGSDDPDLRRASAELDAMLAARSGAKLP